MIPESLRNSLNLSILLSSYGCIYTNNLPEEFLMPTHQRDSALIRTYVTYYVLNH